MAQRGSTTSNGRWHDDVIAQVHAFVTEWGAGAYFSTPSSLRLLQTALSRPDYERLEVCLGASDAARPEVALT